MTTSRALPDDRSTTSRIFPFALATIVALYLLQAISPLRLDNDSVVYLRIAASLADGVTPPAMGLPKGYPAFIALLDSAHLASSITFVLANCAFIGLGLASVWHILGAEHDTARKWAVLLTTLSFPVVRTLPMPLPEPMYFGISLSAVWAMCAADSAEGPRRTRLLLTAITLTGVAITVRLVGLALMPALLWTLFSRAHRRLHAHKGMASAERLLAVVTLLVLPIAVALLLDESFHKYAREGRLRYVSADAARHVVAHARGVVGSIGVLTVNLPGSRIHLPRILFFSIGLAALLTTVTALRVRKPSTPAGLYLATFLLMLALWPYDAIRLWMPIIPVLVTCVAAAELRFKPGRIAHILVGSYVAWFAFSGLGALAYTSRITLSGKDFPKVYGRAGGMSTPDIHGYINQEHNAQAHALMRRYGRPF